MYSKLFLVLVSGLLVTACISHDQDELVFEEEPAAQWQPTPAQKPVVVEAKAPAAAKQQPTWWQQNKRKHTVKIVVPECPCKDPNDPCTHCYQK